mgnify:CR=1 FL=1
MEHAIRMVAIDLDGTLLKDDLAISDRDRQAIRRAMDKGVRVVICTGRMYSTAYPYLEKLQLDTPLICFNGAYIATAGKEHVLDHYSFSTDYARAIYAEAVSRGLHTNYYIEDDINVPELNDLVRPYISRMETGVQVVEDMQRFFDENRTLTKITVQSRDRLALDEFGRWIENTWPSQLYVVKSGTFFLEVSHPYANKGTGVDTIATYYGIPPEQVMCIGDNFNDVSMFHYAGLAVAMGNAEESVKAEADVVTGSYLEDGVALAIEKYVLGEDYE